MQELIRILTVGQDKSFLESRAVLFQEPHYQVQTASDYRQVQSISGHQKFEVALLERVHPDLDKIARLIRNRWPGTQILILSKVTPPLDDVLYDDCVDDFHLEELFASIARLAARSTTGSYSP